MVYIYKGHLGSLYATDEYQEDTYCEACGDSDWLLGTAYNKEEAWNLIKDDTDINGSGGLNYDYVQEFIKGLNFDNY